MLNFQGSLKERWEMFINVGLGWILDLCPGRTALRGLGGLELGERKLLPPFWRSVREQTSAGQERRAGREGPGCSFPHKGWRSLERQLCTPKLALGALKEHHFPVV